MTFCKQVRGSNVQVLAFPALCAGATIAFIIVIQMTYIVEEHPRLHLEGTAVLPPKDLEYWSELKTRDAELGNGTMVNHQASIQGTVAQRGVVDWVISGPSEPEETRINQTELLHNKKAFLKGKTHSVVLDKLPPLKEYPGRLPEKDPTLDVDIVQELHIEVAHSDAVKSSTNPPISNDPESQLRLKEFIPYLSAALAQNGISQNPATKTSHSHSVLLPKPKSAPQHDRVVVPKLVHVMWFHPSENCTFRFHNFICLLSVHKFITPQKIFVWHNSPPCGKWWDEVLQRIPSVELMQIDLPNSVFGRTIRVLEHKTDVLRITLVLRYGGIYIDLDVIALKSWDQLLFYDTTLGAENPNLLGSGVILSVKGAKFMKLWYDSYRAFNDRLWNFNCCRVPMLIATRYPELLHIEWDTLHRPSWGELDYLYTPGKLWDWSINYGVHLWYRFHKVEHDPEDIKTLNTTMGELFRYVYYGTADFVV